MSKLFEPVTIGRLHLSNRIAMSAMTRSRSPGYVPNALNAEYYAQRAGAGLILCESTAIAATAIGFIDTPGIYSDEQMAGWKAVTDAVHKRGGHIVLQLWHCGHNSHPELQPDGRVPFGPSAIPARGSVRLVAGRTPLLTPRALELGEVPALLEEYRVAARLAMAAGFDGVEVHAGNGYLLDQFLRDSTNRRTDRYGGPPENRRRLMLEVVEAVIGVWGADRVGVRLSPTNPSVYEITDSDPEALYASAIDGLNDLNVAFIDVAEGGTGGIPAQCPFDYPRLRRRFKGAYIANNEYTQQKGEAALAADNADMISFGRLYIANPDLAERFAVGAPLTPLNVDGLYAKERVGYLDYPAMDKVQAAQ